MNKFLILFFIAHCSFLCAMQEEIFKCIAEESSYSENKVKNLRIAAQAKFCLESYEFLSFICNKSDSIRQEYVLYVDKIKLYKDIKNKNIWKNKDIENMRELFECLNIINAPNNSDKIINYAGDLRFELIKIIEKPGSYEDFAAQLEKITRALAMDFYANVFFDFEQQRLGQQAFAHKHKHKHKHSCVIF